MGDLVEATTGRVRGSSPEGSPGTSAGSASPPAPRRRRRGGGRRARRVEWVRLARATLAIRDHMSRARTSISWSVTSGAGGSRSPARWTARSRPRRPPPEETRIADMMSQPINLCGLPDAREVLGKRERAPRTSPTRCGRCRACGRATGSSCPSPARSYGTSPCDTGSRTTGTPANPARARAWTPPWTGITPTSVVFPAAARHRRPPGRQARAGQVAARDRSCPARSRDGGCRRADQHPLPDPIPHSTQSSRMFHSSRPTTRDSRRSTRRPPRCGVGA